jgi:cellobiose transport system permease protein
MRLLLGRHAPAGRGSRPAARRVAGPTSRIFRAGPLVYLTLVLAIVLSVFPLYWTVVAATQPNDRIVAWPPPFLPGDRFGGNVVELFSNADVAFARALLNSAIVAGAVTVSVVFFSALAGFAFAKLRFRGRNVALLLVIGTMMVPVQLGMIPLYMLMVDLGWQGDLPSVIVPFLVTGFGVFLMRQYTVQAVPDELVEAARVDGCSTFRIFWSVVLPAVRPAAAVLGLFTFMQMWNEFLWPLIVLNPENPTVQLALSRLASSTGYGVDYSLVLTGTAIATLPLLAVFVLFGRQIIGGIMEGSLKA